MITEFSIIIDLLDMFKEYGFEQDHNGTVFIGKAPHIAPKAWLNVLYPPLNRKEINILEERIKITFPESFRSFLLFSNGASFFSTTLNIYGFRVNYVRNYENLWQPFDIVTPNTTERILDAKDNYLFIGSYDWDGSLLYVDSITDKVYRCSKVSAHPLNEWESILAMLKSEIKRLITIHNNKGMPYNDELPTTP